MPTEKITTETATIKEIIPPPENKKLCFIIWTDNVKTQHTVGRDFKDHEFKVGDTGKRVYEPTVNGNYTNNWLKEFAGKKSDAKNGNWGNGGGRSFGHRTKVCRRNQERNIPRHRCLRHHRTARNSKTTATMMSSASSTNF
jgi:hypothetical protein